MDEKHNLVLVSIVGIVAIVALTISLIPRASFYVPSTSNGVNPFLTTGQAGYSPYATADPEPASILVHGDVCEYDGDCSWRPCFGNKKCVFEEDSVYCDFSLDIPLCAYDFDGLNCCSCNIAQCGAECDRPHSCPHPLVCSHDTCSCYSDILG